ncbi:hypothetical protein H0X32_01945 [Patescibacteria group bacterium]|nr:hypothetical protein [Patescibacteria group bacterium]
MNRILIEGKTKQILLLDCTTIRASSKDDITAGDGKNTINSREKRLFQRKRPRMHFVF